VVVRFDRGSFVAKNPARPRTIEGVVARVHEPGDALEYTSGPEHRDLAELERLAQQLKGLPVVTYDAVTPETPPSHPGDLLSNGAEYHQIGVVLDGRVENGQAIATIYFHDAGALDAIDDGIKELSLGYRCALDAERFQRNIQLDHLSIVPRARCGGQCALRTDAADGSSCGCLAPSVPSAKPPEMMSAGQIQIEAKIVMDDESKQLLADLKSIDAAKVAVEPEAKADCVCNSRAILHTTGDSTMTDAEIQKKLDEALAEIAVLKTAAEKSDLELNQAKADLKSETARADKLVEDITAIKADAASKLDAAKVERTDAEEKDFSARVDARVALLADAAKVGVETKTKVDDKEVSLSDRDIKVAIVKKVDEMDIESDRSMDYVNGMYAGAMKRHLKAAESVAEVRTAIVENKDLAVTQAVTTDITAAEQAARKAAQDKRANRWR
jgi:hypothetical protein